VQDDFSAGKIHFLFLGGGDLTESPKNFVPFISINKCFLTLTLDKIIFGYSTILDINLLEPEFYI